MRTPRITLRCYTEDLALALPSVDEELDAEHPIVEELKSRAASAPQGLKRILAVASPAVYRLRQSRHRGAAWVDTDHDVFWLLAYAQREDGARDDAYRRFAELHESGRLMPTGDDWARMQLESAARRFRALQEDIPRLVCRARERQGACVAVEAAGDIPVRVVYVCSKDVDEVWVAVSTVDARGQGIETRARDMVFALVEAAAGPGEWEYTRAWPMGELEWFEVARYGLTAGER